MTPDSIVLGPLEFERDGDEMFVNRLAVPGDPDGDGDHIATAEGVWDDVWEGFVAAATPRRGLLCDTCFDGRGYLWPHSTNDRTDHSYVERCDGCSRFESDDDAARYIVARLSAQGVKFTASWADVGLSAGQPYVDLTEE